MNMNHSSRPDSLAETAGAIIDWLPIAIGIIAAWWVIDLICRRVSDRMSGANG